MCFPKIELEWKCESSILEGFNEKLTLREGKLLIESPTFKFII